MLFWKPAQTPGAQTGRKASRQYVPLLNRSGTWLLDCSCSSSPWISQTTSRLHCWSVPTSSWAAPVCRRLRLELSSPRSSSRRHGTMPTGVVQWLDAYFRNWNCST
ncbi:hypothetical protein Z043_125490 [Scleropages formosus]|uniref:Uncharacterized protein n=1 Tax=Scleropages formosus TaxID=113540 RepID=A0A0P7TTE5_SCLFO|nr:hypothetical protein Z043_125490 [Scleropages formosus]